MTELMNFLKIIMEDTEKKVVLTKRDLELQTGAILRIRQLLKESSQNSDDPYHNFFRQCLKKTRDMGTKLEYLMSKLRLSPGVFVKVMVKPLLGWLGLSMSEE